MTELSGTSVEIKNVLLSIPPYLKKLEVTGATIQDGSGDPSPDNVRPLHGTTALTVSDGGSRSQTFALPQSLYSLPDGTADGYDAVSGSGLEKIQKLVLDGSQAAGAETVQANTVKFSVTLNNIASASPITADRFKTLNNSNSDVEHIAAWTGWKGVNIFIEKSRLTGWSEGWTNDQKDTVFRAWLSANPVTVLCELASPQPISGEAQTIRAYYPYTRITNDAGAEMNVGINPAEDIRLMSMLTKDYQNSIYILDGQSAIGAEVDRLREAKDDLLSQLNIETATWGLDLWEKAYGIETDVSKSYGFRRSRIKSKRRSQGVTTAAMIKNTAESFSNGEVEVIEHPGEYRFEIRFAGTLGVPPNMDDLTAAIEEIKPAHLSYAYLYVYVTWDSVEAYHHAWDEWDGKDLTWDAFEVYKE